MSAAASLRRALWRVFLQEDVNFLLTNRIPRRYATLFMGWYSRLEIPGLSRLSIAVFRLFADDLHLEEAKSRRFKSLHAFFIRELRDGARPIDPRPEVLVSPCDGIVGAAGSLRGAVALQAKGLDYTLGELLGDPDLAARYRDGIFVTLRLKSNMYHRFHAPTSGRVRQVRHISGDTWNVNPIALERVERLFCRNERAVVELEPEDPSETIALVPVAAIGVASIRLHCLDRVLDLRHRGATTFPCDAQVARGQELGWFEAGSTIIVLAPSGFQLDAGVVHGATLRVGQPLLRRPVRQERTNA